MPITRSAKEKKASKLAARPYVKVQERKKKPGTAQHAPITSSSRRSTVNPLPTRLVPQRPAPDLYVWGAADAGQLGVSVGAEDDDDTDISTPLRHPWVRERKEEGAFGAGPGAGIVSVACGGFQTYLLDELGQVWSCGDQHDGALGRESVTENEAHLRKESSVEFANKFALIQSLTEEHFEVAQVVAGDTMGAVLNKNGDLKVWGTFVDDGKRSFTAHVREQKLPISLLDAGYGECIPDPVASIAASNKHFIALTTSGEIYTWGLDIYGRLGRLFPTRTTNRRSSTLNTSSLCPERVILGSLRRKAVCIGANSDSSFAVDQDGNVWGWGSNSRGQIGLGDTYVGEVIPQPMKIETLSPSKLDTPRNERVVQITGGQFHTLFLTSEGRVYACGSCQDGELGLPSCHKMFSGGNVSEVGTPILVPFPNTDEDPVSGISSSLKYNMVVTRNGSLFSWGFGPQGELGLGKRTELAQVPTMVVGSDGTQFVSSISCGAQHVAGLFRSSVP